MPDRIKLTEFDIPPGAGATLEQVTEGAMRRHIWRMAQATLPGDIDFEVTPYDADNELTGFLVQIYEQPNLPEEQTA